MRLTSFVPVLATALAAALSGPAAAADVDEIMSALQMPAIFAVLSAEGEDYGRELDENMLDGAGGANWADAVRQIYEPGRLLPHFRTALEQTLQQATAADAAGYDGVVDFFRTDFGQQVTALEISARRALLDPDVADASRMTLEEMRAEESPRLALIEEFVTVNELLDSNVSSGLNANLAFYLGLRDAGAIGPEMSEDEMVAEVWSQEEAIREETSIWVHSYLAMAYAPLSDAELGRYTEFTRGDAAQALNRAVSEAYEIVFSDVSRQLGRAAGAVLAGQDL